MKTYTIELWDIVGEDLCYNEIYYNHTFDQAEIEKVFAETPAKKDCIYRLIEHEILDEK